MATTITITLCLFDISECAAHNQETQITLSEEYDLIDRIYEIALALPPTTEGILRTRAIEERLASQIIGDELAQSLQRLNARNIIPRNSINTRRIVA